MKKIEKILKQTIIKNQKKGLTNYNLNYISFNNAQTKKIKQISKFLYKTNFKTEFSEKTFVKFPLTINKISEEKYNLLVNNKSRYISPYTENKKSLKFTSNENILITNILYIIFPTLKICKLIIS
jgi:hypothetical protein